MRLISRLRDERFCAFCKSSRQIYVKKHVDLTNVVGILLVTGATTHVLYGGPDPRGLVLFMSLIVIGEMFIYLRWRAAVICRMCGFDPVLYKKSPERASRAVNEFFKAQAENPQFWMSKSPLLDLHRRMKEGERRRDELVAVRKFVADRPQRMKDAAVLTASKGAAKVAAKTAAAEKAALLKSAAKPASANVGPTRISPSR